MIRLIGHIQPAKNVSIASLQHAKLTMAGNIEIISLCSGLIQSIISISLSMTKEESIYEVEESPKMATATKFVNLTKEKINLSLN